MKKLSTLILSIFLTIFLSACNNTVTKPDSPMEKSNLTHGQVQMTLKKGITTKTEVLETFGAPNITTTDAQSREVWTYQKHGSVQQSSQSNTYGTLIFFGGSAKTSGFEDSSRTMTLIIKFDKNDKVHDFRSRYTSF
jgi:outer membrane protein assembly factor BamE (lipoprotein component of BamABCDE complex)